MALPPKYTRQLTDWEPALKIASDLRRSVLAEIKFTDSGGPLLVTPSNRPATVYIACPNGDQLTFNCVVVNGKLPHYIMNIIVPEKEVRQYLFQSSETQFQ